MRLRAVAFTALALAILVPAGLVLSQSRDAARIGIMMPLEQIAPVGKDARPDLRGAEFSGAVALQLPSAQITIDEARISFLAQSAYTEVVNLIEQPGRYDLQQALDLWQDYAEVLRRQPDWHAEVGILNDPLATLQPRANALLRRAGFDQDADANENARIVLAEMTPGGALATRRLDLMRGWYRMPLNGRDFFVGTELVATFDADRPKTPYAFAFHLYLHAGSVRCLRGFSSLYAELTNGQDVQSLQRKNTGDLAYDPALLTAFQEWDRMPDLPSVRPYIDSYVFDACDLNDSAWGAIGLPLPD